MGRYGRSGRRRGPARCDECRRPFVWLRLRGGWRKFDPVPVDGRTHVGAPAHPVEGKNAWSTLRECVEDLMVRRRVSSAQAESEAYDMPWFAVHQCPPHTNGFEISDPSTRIEPENPEGTLQ